VAVVVREPWCQPFLDDAALVHHVVRHLVQHPLPARNLVPVPTQFARSGDGVAQELLGHRHVHGGVVVPCDLVLPGVFSAIALARRPTYRRPFVEVILKEQRGLFHERQGVFGEELAVAGVEIVVVEEMRRPAGAPNPKAPAKFGARRCLNPWVEVREGSTMPRAPNRCFALISSQGTMDSR